MTTAATNNDQLKELIRSNSGIFPMHMDEIVFNASTLSVDDVQGPDANNKYCVVWPFVFKSELANLHDKLHGGMAAYLVDAVTSIHLALIDGRHQHVSMHLSLNYIRPVPIGETVLLKTFINGRGKTAAFLAAEFWSADDKVIYLTATHSKIFVGKERPHTNQHIAKL
jgi:acyl-coenzyme A thioesterase PaaI-like protein